LLLLKTFQGTYYTLIKNCGFSEEKAKSIESSYHEMYKVSDQWVQNKLEQACKDGYVTLAFGIKLRTPMLKQIIWNSDSIPQVALAEGRTAGNAVSGQSYGLLNSRACNEFMKRVRNSPYKYDIKICAQIHDSSYYVIKDDVDVVKWVNDNLIECIAFQDLPEIWHEEVKLTSSLEIHHPDWSHKIGLPNHASIDTIRSICKKETQ